MLFLSSAYHELDFTVEDRNTIYWHHTVPKYSQIKRKEHLTKVYLRLGVDGAVCYTCNLNILIKPTLMEIVQVGQFEESNHNNWTQALNPGQPELPDWVYNGAILGVQGGTDTMLMRLEDARAHGIQVKLDVNHRMDFSRLLECGSKTGLEKLSPTLELGFSGTGGGTRPGIQTWTQSSGGFLFLFNFNHLLPLKGPGCGGSQSDRLCHSSS